MSSCCLLELNQPVQVLGSEWVHRGGEGEIPGLKLMNSKFKRLFLAHIALPNVILIS